MTRANICHFGKLYNDLCSVLTLSIRSNSTLRLNMGQYAPQIEQGSKEISSVDVVRTFQIHVTNKNTKSKKVGIKMRTREQTIEWITSMCSKHTNRRESKRRKEFKKKLVLRSDCIIFHPLLCGLVRCFRFVHYNFVNLFFVIFVMDSYRRKTQIFLFKETNKNETPHQTELLLCAIIHGAAITKMLLLPAEWYFVEWNWTTKKNKSKEEEEEKSTRSLLTCAIKWNEKYIKRKRR